MASWAQLSCLAGKLRARTSFQKIPKNLRLHLCLCLVLSFLYIAIWLTTTLFFAHMGLTYFAPIVPDASSFLGVSIGSLENANDIATTSYLFSNTDRSELAKKSALLLFLSSCLPALSWFLARSQLRDLLNPRINKQNEHMAVGSISENSGLNNDGLTLLDLNSQGSSRTDLLLEKVSNTQFNGVSEATEFDYTVLIINILLCGSVAILNGMTGGHTMFILKNYFGIPISQSIAGMLVFGFTAYYLCDTISVVPKMWCLASHIEVVFSRDDDSTHKAPETVSVDICEICRAAISSGQVMVVSPTVNSGCCGDEGSKCKHCSHILCFSVWSGANCPGCQAELRCYSFDIADNLFAWTYIIGIMTHIWAINKCGLHKAFFHVSRGFISCDES